MARQLRQLIVSSRITLITEPGLFIKYANLRRPSDHLNKTEKNNKEVKNWKYSSKMHKWNMQNMQRMGRSVISVRKEITSFLSVSRKHSHTKGPNLAIACREIIQRCINYTQTCHLRLKMNFGSYLSPIKLIL